ncbi:MAG: HAD family phosphatase [Clostridia bacterium]|jgi:HAD superfamily hydrolase (TIGR01509 family)|nr:HAD family phosphatase [Clostridia bacterium]
MFKGAVFDVDGTLVDSLFIWGVLWSGIGKTYAGDASFRPRPEDDKKIRTMLLKDTMALLHTQYGLGESGEELLAFANRLIERFYREEICLKDGVTDFLEYLKAQNIPMCIATANSEKLIRLAMQRCGLDRYFSKVISCYDVGKGKDEPHVFLEASRYLGTSVAQTCVFEDSLTAVKTAKKAGFQTVAIYDEKNYGQEELAKTADVYIPKGKTLKMLIL